MAAATCSCYRGAMKNTLIALLLGLTSMSAFAADEVPLHPYIEIVTTEGTIILELDGKQAPLTVGHIPPSGRTFGSTSFADKFVV